VIRVSARQVQFGTGVRTARHAVASSIAPAYETLGNRPYVLLPRRIGAVPRSARLPKLSPRNPADGISTSRPMRIFAPYDSVSFGFDGIDSSGGLILRALFDRSGCSNIIILLPFGAFFHDRRESF